MNKFAQMTTQQFCDYVSSNPGGARKAYLLRIQDNPECNNPEIVYRDRVVYRERDRINVQYVEKEVEVVKYLNPVEWLIHQFKQLELNVL